MMRNRYTGWIFLALVALGTVKAQAQGSWQFSSPDELLYTHLSVQQFAMPNPLNMPYEFVHAQAPQQTWYPGGTAMQAPVGYLGLFALTNTDAVMRNLDVILEKTQINTAASSFDPVFGVPYRASTIVNAIEKELSKLPNDTASLPKIETFVQNVSNNVVSGGSINVCSGSGTLSVHGGSGTLDVNGGSLLQMKPAGNGGCIEGGTISGTSGLTKSGEVTLVLNSNSNPITVVKGNSGNLNAGSVTAQVATWISNGTITHQGLPNLNPTIPLFIHIQNKIIKFERTPDNLLLFIDSTSGNLLASGTAADLNEYINGLDPNDRQIDVNSLLPGGSISRLPINTSIFSNLTSDTSQLTASTVSLTLSNPSNAGASDYRLATNVSSGGVPANVVPEPGVLVLLLSGVLAWIASRKWRR